MSKKGFSLIEVTLVLAIAGVIFLMVFVALPGLWRSERDSQRRDDMLTFVDTLKNFQSNNNRGALPTLTTGQQNRLNDGSYFTIIGDDITPSSKIEGNTWTDFYKNYFNDGFTDPDGPRYNWTVTYCSINPKQNLDTPCSTDLFSHNTIMDQTFKDQNYNFYITLGAKCYGENAYLSANARKVAVLYKLESGGIYCTET